MVRVFVLLVSFSIFGDRRSLKIENENNSLILNINAGI